MWCRVWALVSAVKPGINIPIFEVDVNLVEFADNAIARGCSVAPQTLGVAVVTTTVPGKKVVVGSALRHALISLEEVPTRSAERQTKATARFALRVTHHAALFSRQNTRTLSARKDLLVEPILAALFRRKTLRHRLTVSGKNHEATAVAAAGSNDVPRTSTALLTVRMARLADPVLILVLRNRTFRNAIRSIAGISTLAAIVVSRTSAVVEALRMTSLTFFRLRRSVNPWE